ncbi:MAG: bifunctional 5,10-methylenetetrahydrofolate dehydrogenase/5,10-methenyltetrahydrofolate cyclohydrolase [Thermoplasmata archaeon]|nr:bifunctional 5,10-methylenetetrahydrofolate dehydrogenase/5,10-methenyltetrahydrofolate cyclohydrolase [Thermoplasmata archaeon]
MRRPPALGMLTVGYSPGTDIFLGQVRGAARRLGVRVEERHVEAEEEAAIEGVLDLADIADSVLIGHPVPQELDFDALMGAMPHDRDVEGLHPANLGRLISGEVLVVPPTPAACLELLDREVRDLRGSEVVIVNHSPILGRPLSVLLLRRDCTVTVCHVHTRDLRDHTRGADVIVTGAGVPSLIGAGMVKAGAVVIDVGMNRVGGRVCGDVDTASVLDVASAVTPVPGGVGPVTVSMLMRNLVRMAIRN